MPAHPSFEELVEVLDVPFRFTPRPDPVPPELRPAWRVAVLLLILEKCRGAKATWKQLHFLNWAVRSREGQGVLLRAFEGVADPSQIIVRYEPALDRAVDLAVGHRLATWEDGHQLALTDKGKAVLAQLSEPLAPLERERQFLASLPGKISQSTVDRILSGHA